MLVTGSTRGLGAYILKEFCQRGHDVVMNGRNEIGTLHEALWKDASNISVSDLRELNIDVVVNNAFDKYSCVASGEAQIHVLDTAMMFFKSRQRGLIININSVAAFGNDSPVYAYHDAKSNLRRCSKAYKIDSWNSGVYITDVYPGAIKTDWTKDRENWNALIDPQELASFIVDLVKPSTFYVDEIILRRPKCLQKEENK